MKPLTLEETKLKEEMKNNCLKVGKYKDEKAKDKFEMLCHLEDFEVQYWELQQENKELKEELVSANESITWWNNRFNAITRDNKQLQERIEYLERSNNRREDTILEQRQKIGDLEDNWNKLKEWASNFYNSEEVGWAGCGMRYTLEKMQELEGSD